MSKKILIGLVIFTYLMGSFQNAAFELIHTMSHQFSSNHSYHSHHDEKVAVDHEHEVLDLSKTALEEQAPAKNSQKHNTQISFDKIPQICALTPIVLTYADQKNRVITSLNLQLPPIPFLPTNNPPPQS